MVKANFNPQVNGLSVGFINASTGNPLTFVWDFGDGNTSTDNNPTHVYGYAGYFTITLTATDGVTSNVYSLLLGVSAVGPTLSASIKDLVLKTVPSDIIIDPSILSMAIQKWQSFLQPLVKPKVQTIDTFNEFAYTALANTLIILLVSYELILNGAESCLIQIGGDTKVLKSVGTDPAKAEFFSKSDLWKGLMAPGGLFINVQSNLCMLAYRLRIPLHICPELPRPIIGPLMGSNRVPDPIRVLPLLQELAMIFGW